MSRARTIPTITLTARGPAAIGLGVLLLFGLFGLPRLLSTPLSPDEARSLIRELRLRQVSDHHLPLLHASSTESAAAVAKAMAAAIKDVQNQPLGDVRVRRSWLGPPFAKRWTYVVETRRPGVPRPDTYRIRGSLAMEVPRFWWYLPVF